MSNAREKQNTTARTVKGNLSRFVKLYKHPSPTLRARLDKLGKAELRQHFINEIVLWKVSRYASPAPEVLRETDKLRRLKPNEHRNGTSELTALLTLRGVDLAMASRIMRIRNPAVFQIVDHHMYAAVYGTKYPLSGKSSTDQKVALYFDYLDALGDLCAAKKLEFTTIDRVLFEVDKDQNGNCSPLQT